MSNSTHQSPSAATAPMRGALIVVSSPSGGGKGTLIKRVLATTPDLHYSVSSTTRVARADEQQGRDYFFVSVAEFERMIGAGEFLEWANVHGNFYGTGRKQVERELSAGYDIVLEIDVQGARLVRAQIGASISVFILPPSYEVLRQRLTARGSETPNDLQVRLANSRAEVACFEEFDYVLINDDVEIAAERLRNIVLAERSRSARQSEAAQNVLKTFR